MGSYDDVKPGDGFDRWHHATCRNYSLTECRPVPDAAFEATVAVRPFGELVISRISSRVKGGERLCVTRGEREIRRDQRDDYFIWIARAGAVMFEQAGRSVTLGPGDLMLHDQARPFALAFSDTAAAMMIAVPRPLLDARLAGSGACVARRIDGEAPWARLAALMATECADAGPAATTSPTPRLWEGALDVWSGVLAAAFEDESTTGQSRRSRLDEVKSFLLQHLDDPDLDAQTIAARMSMSRRTLMRLFAAEGITPLRWLWNERLRASREALRQGRFRRVTDAAFAFGFRSHSHFSRSFRSLYNCTPTQLFEDRAKR